MDLFSWDDARYCLGVAEMDITHREFIALANRLASADDASFPGLFEALLGHTQQHFAAEDANMQASGFAAMGEHMGEHRRVLLELHQFNRSVQAGRLRLARAYVREGLRSWFDGHLATMDSALAAHLKRQNSAN